MKHFILLKSFKKHIFIKKKSISQIAILLLIAVVAVLLMVFMESCNVKSKEVIFINSHPSDFVYKVEDEGGNIYYTNLIKEVSATCIAFTAQDTLLKKVCGTYSITLLRY
jgi:hypothetical protein